MPQIYSYDVYVYVYIHNGSLNVYVLVITNIYHMIYTTSNICFNHPMGGPQQGWFLVKMVPEWLKVDDMVVSLF